MLVKNRFFTLSLKELRLRLSQSRFVYPNPHTPGSGIDWMVSYPDPHALGPGIDWALFYPDPLHLAPGLTKPSFTQTLTHLYPRLTECFFTRTLKHWHISFATFWSWFKYSNMSWNWNQISALFCTLPFPRPYSSNICKN